jgi:hypothetical protein
MLMLSHFLCQLLLGSIPPRLCMPAAAGLICVIAAVDLVAVLFSLLLLADESRRLLENGQHRAGISNSAAFTIAQIC